MARLTPGRWLNAQIRLIAWLGEELLGESFLAEQRQPHSGKVLQVKVLRADPCRAPAYLERFRQTAERAVALDHPHAAAVHAFGVLEEAGEPPRPIPGVAAPPAPLGPRRPLPVALRPAGYPWIASEHVPGQDLHSFLLDGVPGGVLADLLLPVADVLDQAAALGLWHGEVSPANIMVVPGPPPRAVLLDLGLATVLPDDPLEVPLTPGMLCYRSPEQCTPGAADEVGPAADRYALAVLLYEGVAGRPPFWTSDCHEMLRLHRSAPVPPLRTLVPSLALRCAPALDAFFVRALAKQPEARFPTATAVVQEFLQALDLPEQAERHLRPRRRSPRWYRIRQREDERVAVDVVVGPRAVLGKQLECDVVCHALPSPEHDVVTAGVSREHAVLIWLDDRLSVLDQSINGTFVNDRRAGPRLTPVPDGAHLRLGEHLGLHVTLVGPARAGDEALDEGEDPPVAGALLTRRDPYSAGVPPTLVLWQRMDLPGSPLARLGGAMAAGQVWVTQNELWWSGDAAVHWLRRDGTRVLGAAPLRHGDSLLGRGGALIIEH